MSITTNVRMNAEGSFRPTIYLDRPSQRPKDGDFYLRRIQTNIANKTVHLSVPIQLVRKLALSQGDIVTISLLEDEEHSRLVVEPLHIQGRD